MVVEGTTSTNSSSGCVLAVLNTQLEGKIGKAIKFMYFLVLILYSFKAKKQRSLSGCFYMCESLTVVA